jgi:hypothetical protein
MVCIQPVVLGTSLTKVTVGVPQASVATIVAGVGAGTVPLQASVTFGGQVITGGIASTTVIMACAVVVHPLASVTVTV